MTEKDLKEDALHFRKAIEQARDHEKFDRKNRMSNFPYDCELPKKSTLNE